MLTRDPRANDPSSAAHRRFAAYREKVGTLDVVRIVPPFVPVSLFSVSRGSYDVVTSPDPFETGIVAYVLSRRIGAALELQIHTDLWSPFYREESWKNRIRMHLARWLIPRADCIRVVSSRIKRGIEDRLTPRKSTRFSLSVLPVFPEISKGESGPDLHEKYPQFETIALVLSRLTREKNIPMILRAFAEALRKNPRSGLIVVGSGPEEAVLKRLAVTLGIAENVVFEGWASRPGSYFASADLFLSASDYEGYGLTFLEAATAGCPILTTDVGCIGDVLPYDAVVSVPARDEAAYTSALVGLVSFPDVRRATVDRAKAAAQKIGTFDEYVKRMVDFWKTCGSQN